LSVPYLKLPVKICTLETIKDDKFEISQTAKKKLKN